MSTEQTIRKIHEILNESQFSDFFNKSAFGKLIAPEGYSNPRTYFHRKLDPKYKAYEFTEEEAQQVAETLLMLASHINKKLQ